MTNTAPTLDLSAIPLGSFYIDGNWTKASSDKTIDVISPNTKTVIAQVADANEDDIEAAVKAARRAFDDGAWSSLTFKQRAEWLRKLSAEIGKHLPELSLFWTEEIGVPYQASQGMTGFFSTALESYAEIGDTFEQVVEAPTQLPGKAYLAYEPVGVVAAIAPWNVPLWTMLNKIGPALLTGCTVIMKPAPETPLEAYVVARCADAIGLPAGVLNLINAGREGSDYLVRQSGVDKVSFTGSLATGRRIASVCAERIARCTLELGGKSAAIILDDYDLEEAANILVSSVLGLSGQNCGALTRILVSEDRQEDLLA
ncbi:MAG: aldehyde dehydrogenase family protein, partial [Chromatocurvus sp.]